LKEDLKDKNSYYPKHKLKQWIRELQKKIKTGDREN
jgi:hypothetical protein